MNHTIIGTAGHVDHGKTLLIKALTGIDTDRLKEEKKRGITIELGFAYLDLPDGGKAGIIDVPGHEKFVRNMLAGAGGIDLALLVIAADDGVMPQTREHLGILQLLGIQQGVIVLTKCDLAEPDWVELVKEDVKKEVEGTFLQDAPIMAVSAYTGQGIDELRQHIYTMVRGAAQKNTTKPFRVPVDRVFSVDGFGTVITGTLIEGALSEGDEVQVYPQNLRSRVRNLQVHGGDVQTAWAGQRVAVNLAGIKKEELQRGDVLAVPGSMENTLMLDVKLDVLKDSARVLKNGTRLHFYHGAQDVLCKLVLLDGDALAPGGAGYAQLRFTQPVAVKRGDHFVVRFYSPVETVGGGVVLDPAPQKHRRKQQAVLDALRVREQGSAADNLLQAVTEASAQLLPLAEVQRRLVLDDAAFAAELDAMEKGGDVVRLTARVAVSAAYLDGLAQKLARLMEEWHGTSPLLAGMRRDELRSRLLPGAELALADKLLELMLQRGVIRSEGTLIAAAGFTVQYSEADKKLADAVMAAFEQGGYAPPAAEEVLERWPKQKAAAKRVFDAMLADGRLVMTSPQIYFAGSTVQQAKDKVAAFIGQNGQITLAQFRDMSGTSRKFALSLLEYFDRQGLTKKVGDARVLAG